jgi:MoxR-like ATPase
MREYVEQILKEVGKVIIGKDDVVRKVMMCLLASGHMLMEDVPGVGKTTLALAFARALDLETKRVQFTSDTVPSDVVGVSTPDKATGEFIYKPGAIMTNILLADEINRTSSKTQSALLEAMEEQNVTVDGKTYPLPSPFIVLATQNPVGASGTQMLPDSQLDRFLVRVSMGYPDFESQVSILKDRKDSNPLDTVKSVVTREKLRELVAATTQVHIADTVYAYVTTLTEATRNHPMITLGVSPRGALSLCRIAKAKAFISGRDYVVPEDVAEVAPDVFVHRLILGSKARFGEVTAAGLMTEILEQTPMPVLKDPN